MGVGVWVCARACVVCTHMCVSGHRDERGTLDLFCSITLYFILLSTESLDEPGTRLADSKPHWFFSLCISTPNSAEIIPGFLRRFRGLELRTS